MLYLWWMKAVLKLCKVSKHCDINFLFSRLKSPFLGKFGQKNKKCLFELKFGTWTNWHIQNSMVISFFFFFFFDRNYPFWANLVQKNRNWLFKLKFSFVFCLTQICRICLICLTQICLTQIRLFCNRPESPILGKFGPKNQNCLNWNFVFRLIQISWIRCWCTLFL